MATMATSLRNEFILCEKQAQFKVHIQDESECAGTSLCVFVYTSYRAHIGPCELHSLHKTCPPELNSSAALSCLKSACGGEKLHE